MLMRPLVVCWCHDATGGAHVSPPPWCGKAKRGIRREVPMGVALPLASVLPGLPTSDPLGSPGEDGALADCI